MRNWNELDCKNNNIKEQDLLLTYEELKLSGSNICCSFSNIYYLPMRNWNYDVCYSISFLHIEFTTYLWGIETSTNHNRSCSAYHIYYLPMRNWNIFFAITCIIIIWFTTYLWGIETRKQKHFKPKCNKFTTYLWGIETNFVLCKVH